MSPISRVLVLTTSFLLLVTILELVRRGKLREEYSLLLLLTSGVIFFSAALSGVLGRVADFLEITESSFLVGAVFLVTFSVQIAQGVIVSSLSLHNRDLAQKVAELDWQLHQLRDYIRTLEEQQDETTSAWMKAVREMVTLDEGSEEEPTT